MSDHAAGPDKHQKYLDEHERLVYLFTTDRFAFELERKRALNETIDNADCNEEWKEKMRAQQKEWDRILNKAGSAENRFAMIQAIFWHHVVNTWQPGLQEYATVVRPQGRIKKSQTALSLVEKR